MPQPIVEEEYDFEQRDNPCRCGNNCAQGKGCWVESGRPSGGMPPTRDSIEYNYGIGAYQPGSLPLNSTRPSGFSGGNVPTYNPGFSYSGPGSFMGTASSSTISGSRDYGYSQSTQVNGYGYPPGSYQNDTQYVPDQNQTQATTNSYLYGSGTQDPQYTSYDQESAYSGTYGEYEDETGYDAVPEKKSKSKSRRSEGKPKGKSGKSGRK